MFNIYRKLFLLGFIPLICFASLPNDSLIAHREDRSGGREAGERGRHSEEGRYGGERYGRYGEEGRYGGERYGRYSEEGRYGGERYGRYGAERYGQEEFNMYRRPEGEINTYQMNPVYSPTSEGGNVIQDLEELRQLRGQ